MKTGLLAICGFVAGTLLVEAQVPLDGVRERLRRVGQEITALEARAEPALRREEIPGQIEAWRSPTTADLQRMREAVPWRFQYLRLLEHEMLAAPAVVWPKEVQGPSLRKLLEDGNPFVRALAAEALASLFDPADVPRLAQLLDDAGVAPPP